ncbi:chromate efflux transporter [Parahaliea aestuarii]|uniref:Chromate efflux transporter n=1 Tax=Parahaliea aestuarii TaxID=1852021 RepID=A0A5C8ZRA1_9GAMM|nr:chromate efflux transporter [Parahaliea aestuarii]
MWRFLLLGCVSFGGPAAHIGYFRRAFVERLQWLDERQFGDLLALCQFLPGPASSQLGFAIGRQRAGLAGALCAFIGFSLPSLVLMYLLAVWGADVMAGPLAGVAQGMKLLAVVVVADAVWQMGRMYCRRRVALLLALLATVVLLLSSRMWAQYLVLLSGAAVGGWLLCERKETAGTAADGRWQWPPLVCFAALFLLLPLVADQPLSTLFNAFFQAGSLVFGGGHVVLPLLQQGLAGSLPADDFLLGYAAAQAVPGPMFSLSAYLGALLNPQLPLAGALLAVAGIFLPGFLLLLGLQGRWATLSRRRRVAGAVAGVNAVVVGLLLAALYRPLWQSSIHSAVDVGLVLAGIAALWFWRLPLLLLVAAFALVGALLY